MDFGLPYLLEKPSIEDTCRLAQELGLAFVELNACFPACAPEQLRIPPLRALSSRYGVYFTLHAHEECDPFCLEENVRLAWLASLRHALALAVRLDMPTVNMHLAKGVYVTLPEERVYLYARYEERYHSHLQELRALAEHVLIGSGTRLCIENTGGFMPHELAALDFLLESPVIGLTLDIGHDHGAGSIDLPYYEQHPSKLWHMHVHDGVGNHPHKALGDGEIDWKARLALGDRCGARAVLETKTVDALRRSVDVLKHETSYGSWNA